jgi:hypothetical protein
MTSCRSTRRDELGPSVEAVFSAGLVGPALDVLELFELAWRYRYWDSSPPEEFVADLLAASNGHLEKLTASARVAVGRQRPTALHRPRREFEPTPADLVGGPEI